MKYKSNSLRIISVCLLLFTGFNAVIAGSLFVLDPSGKKMGMTLSYLSDAPFSNYLIPSLTLLFVNGLLNILTAFAALKHRRYYPLWTLIQGVLLSGWIALQVLWVHDFNFLHLTMLTIGILLICCGIILRGQPVISAQNKPAYGQKELDAVKRTDK